MLLISASAWAELYTVHDNSVEDLSAAYEFFKTAEQLSKMSPREYIDLWEQGMARIGIIHEHGSLEIFAKCVAGTLKNKIQK